MSIHPWPKARPPTAFPGFYMYYNSHHNHPMSGKFLSGYLSVASRVSNKKALTRLQPLSSDYRK